jgi:hypothetical protein
MIGDDSPLGNLITMPHYAEIAAKLAQPILAATLVGDFTVPEEISSLRSYGNSASDR